MIRNRLRRRSSEKIIFLVSLLYSIPNFAFTERTQFRKFPIIQKISYQDREIQSLRSEITQNMKLASSNTNMTIKWRLYKIKKNDQFFQIMAKTMQNPDTISSINRLSSVWDLEAGDTWLIPNMRGIAEYGKKSKLAKKYKVKIENIVRIPSQKETLQSIEKASCTRACRTHKNFYFILGVTFKPEERSYFGLLAFERPVAGIVSSQYGIRRDPFSKKFRFHKGIDIACKMNSKVWAAADGKVIFTGHLPSYGKTVIIEHQNGYQSLYGHLNKIATRKGSSVSKKRTIAYSGNSGRTTGPHLHFEIRRQGRARKPRFLH